MSTHCLIAKQNVDGSIYGIYCHWDGYEAHVGKLLKEHYTDPTKVNLLLALGDISSLAPEIGEKHSFNDPNRDWTVAYARDRGEKRRAWHRYPSPDAARPSYRYVYVFSDGKWTTA
jgi:hypothetical protein